MNLKAGMLTKYYLIALTLVTFFTFGLDKWLAKKGRHRISENVLFTLTFFGGTFGAVLGMAFFKHKTSKKSFSLKILLLILFQILLIYILKEHLTDKL